MQAEKNEKRIQNKAKEALRIKFWLSSSSFQRKTDNFKPLNRLRSTDELTSIFLCPQVAKTGLGSGTKARAQIHFDGILTHATFALNGFTR